MSLADFLIRLNGSGITLGLGAKPGTLRVEAPVGALPAGLRTELLAHKTELLGLLGNGGPGMGDHPAATNAKPAVTATMVPAASSPAVITTCSTSLGIDLVGNSTVTISGRQFCYERRWAGRRLQPADGYLALDTETEVVDLKRQVPRLALASASAGDDESVLIHPDDLGRFILAHRDLQLVFHNVAFDFWVIQQHLRSRDERDAVTAWWEMADAGRLHDSMLLDMLVRLARDDRHPDPRNLAEVAQAYAGLAISKDDPYRLRYGEIGQDWDHVELGFFEYAIKDPIVTRIAYGRLRHEAQSLVTRYRRQCSEILPNAVEQFGLLTEALQVKKAIALAQISRRGMLVDVEAVRRNEQELRRELLAPVASAHAICPVYKVDQHGDFAVSGKSQVPAINEKELRKHLEQIKQEIERNREVPLPIPMTKKGISCSVEKWAEYKHLHPFLAHWTKAKGMAKLIQFFAQFQDQVDVADVALALGVEFGEFRTALRLKLDEDGSPIMPAMELTKRIKTRAKWLRNLGLEPERVAEAVQRLAAARREPHCAVHPHYSVMVRTGRTSCDSPNIQQIPRESTFRQVFVAPPGSCLLAVDYSFIELRTFAATALHRYGWSRMADVIKAGVDPHAHTAAMMLSVPLEEFMAWKGSTVVAPAGPGEQATEKLGDRFKSARQAAKSVNFGVPGGLGVASLVAYAKASFQVTLSPKEAKERRERLIKQIYPEMDLYLADDAVAIVARNLQAPIELVRQVLGDFHLTCIRKVLAGNPRRNDGEAYKASFVTRIWSALTAVNQNPELREALVNRQPSEELASRVCLAGVATLTGRIRGRVRFSQGRNTPFQGLAGDGAALALYRLVREGFVVTGFVHDEVLVLLPDEGGYVSEAKVRRVEEIMCRAMEEMLVGDIPVECEATLSRCWSKQAKLIVQDGKVIPWEPKT